MQGTHDAMGSWEQSDVMGSQGHGYHELHGIMFKGFFGESTSAGGSSHFIQGFLVFFTRSIDIL